MRLARTHQDPNCLCLPSAGIGGLPPHTHLAPSYSYSHVFCFIYFAFRVYVCFGCMHVCAPCACLWGLLKMGYRWLWATIKVLRNKPRLSGRTASAVSLWAVSLAPLFKYNFNTLVFWERQNELSALPKSASKWHDKVQLHPFPCGFPSCC